MAITPYTYQQKAVFISSGDYLSNQTGAGSIQQISRVQDITWGITYPIQSQSYIDAGTETILPTRPTVQCTLNWLLTNGYNEQAAGFLTDGISGALLGMNTQRNLYIVTEDSDGRDVIGNSYSSSTRVIGVGQILLNSYSLNAAVGEPINISANFEGLNAISYSNYSGQDIPSVDPNSGNQITGQKFSLPAATQQYSRVPLSDPESTLAALASDITLEFVNNTPFAIDGGLNQLPVQSFNLSIDLQRQGMMRYGSVFPSDRPINFPIDVNLTVEALVDEYQSAALQNFGCMTTTGNDINLIVQPFCGGVPVEFNLRGLQIKSQESTLRIGDMEKVQISWNGTIANPYSPINNIYFRSYNASGIPILGIHYLTGSDYEVVTSDGYNIRVY